jgi:hypothetical protein
LEQKFSAGREPPFREDFEPGSREIANVEAVTRQLLVEVCRLQMTYLVL